MSDFQERMNKLSPREKQVCDALKQNPGLTRRGIGTQLGISHHTVDVYLRRVYAKTGVNNRYELVANIVKKTA